MEYNGAIAAIVWIILWNGRSLRCSPVAFQDLLLYIGYGLWMYFQGLSIAFCLISVVFFFTIWHSVGPLMQNKNTKHQLITTRPLEAAEPPLKPRVYLSRTTHTRLFPKIHSFSYPYLLVGIPVGWRGQGGSVLPVDSSIINGLFYVNSSDYLDRNDSLLSLDSKLKLYLQSQGVDKHAYPYAYLVTAPRVFGYSFNPVSFWYLYSTEKKLEAMILEVNNTFDERRMYLLQGHEDQNDTELLTETPISQLNQMHSASSSETERFRMEDGFSRSWKKDFHVSPFNSRNGSYSLLALDPRPFHSQNCGSISNTITLRSSESHPKLVARIFSTSSPIDPTELIGWARLKFLLDWMWVGFLTFPRIVKEAYKLYFQRKLRVWYRPEVMQSSLARRPTNIERDLESYFLSYLRYTVGQTMSSLHLTYIPPLQMGPRTEISSGNCGSCQETSNKLEIKVISPSFYHRFVHYAHTAEAFNREFLCCDPKDRCIWISSAALLELLFPDDSNYRTTSKSVFSSLSREYQVRWSFLKILRCPPSAQSYSDTPDVTVTLEYSNVRSKGLSQLDVHVIKHCPDQLKYWRTVIQVFLAQRFTGGYPLILEIADLGFRLLLIHTGWRLTAINIMPTYLMNAPLGFAMACTMSCVTVGIHNLLHAWEYLKGV